MKKDIIITNGKTDLDDYIKRSESRYNRMVELKRNAEKLCMSEESLTEWKEKTERLLGEINNFDKTLNGDFLGGGGPTIRVQTYNPRRGGDWKTLYQYQMNNVDDLMNLIIDRLYRDLEHAIMRTNEIVKDINEMHDGKWN